MTQRRFWTRRQFLANALAAAGAFAAPDLWSKRQAFGQVAGARAQHFILMYAGGGLRCSSAFNAGEARQLNPYGIHTGSRGWRVSGIFNDQRVAVPSMGMEMPSFVELSDTWSILGNVDHTPGTPRGDGGHGTAYLRMGTGDPTGRAGIMSIINREIGLPQGIPTFIVGGTARFFGLAAGEMTAQRPVFLNGADDFQRLTSTFGGDGVGWEADLERWLDDRSRVGCHDFHNTMLEASVLAKDQAREFLDEFDDDVMNVNGAPEAELHGITNLNLQEIFPNDGAWGRMSALAVRLIQKGSPGVAIGVGGYDTHSGEAGGFDQLMDSYGRALQGLYFALSNSPHPLGGSFWDHTMILGVSEFGRDNTSELSGYNRGDGSDHQGTNPCRYQTFPIGGGAVMPGATIGQTDEQSWAPRDGVIYSSRQVLASVMDAMGIDKSVYGFGEDQVIQEIFV